MPAVLCDRGRLVCPGIPSDRSGMIWDGLPSINGILMGY